MQSFNSALFSFRLYSIYALKEKSNIECGNEFVGKKVKVKLNRSRLVSQMAAGKSAYTRQVHRRLS